MRWRRHEWVVREEERMREGREIIWVARVGVRVREAVHKTAGSQVTQLRGAAGQ